MTSHQNHLRPLNGNKQILLVIGFSLILSSCGLIQTLFGEPEEEVVIETPEIKEDTSAVISENQIDSVKDEVIEPVKAGKWAKKPAYDMGFILPFSTDRKELDRLLEQDNITGMQTLASLEFYEGVLVALDTLKELGLNLNIHLYNDYRDTQSLQTTLKKEELKNCDVVIGPIFTDGISVANEWAKKEEIFIVSPFSPSDASTTNNPFFLMASSTMRTQLSELCKTMIENSENTNTVIISNNGVTDSIINKYFSEAYNNISVDQYKPKAKLTSDFDEIENLLIQGKDNIVLLASIDELFVNEAMRKLSLLSKSYDIEIGGLSQLLDMESLSLDYFETLKFHYPTAYYINPFSPKLEAFNEQFIKRFGSTPTNYSYQGYDLTLTLATMLYQYGPFLPKGIEKNPMLTKTLARYLFKANMSDDNIEYYENKNVSILRFEQYRFEKINKP